MDFELTDEQALLREASRDLLTDRAPVSVLRTQLDDDAEVDPTLWRLAGDLGWTGLLIGEEHGGSGQGLIEAALVAEETGRAVARGPFLPALLVARAVDRGGAEELRTEVLPALADGSAWATWAFAEPGRPWSPEGLGTTVRAEGNDVLLTGTKTAVQDADGARWLLVTALERGEPVSYLVDRDSAGLTVRRQRTLDLTRTFAEVRLDDVRVPSSRRLDGAPGALHRLLDDAAVLSAAQTLGTLERLLELTVEYVKVRVQFGRSIGSFQAVKQAVATMAMQVQGARAATYYAAMAADADAEDAARAACVAASYTSAVAGDVAGSALQLHGGIGFTWEHDLHLFLRRAKADAVLQGDAALHRSRLVDLLTGQSVAS
ncbi:acyl-CoA dehydrogenase family protein [Cryptosporangium aurantiacum]|uniref:Acyl-CoA dehydrogenase n=1 Tax=Cryptosporangium aurantiacum TaxID=134849 RepID=A0A1M7R4U2_9ACTN|nr:acyl-CoA dehydrogenase family protein [Cryptosporangium aurantiacum]SHN39897.1 Acyl-CoA dehydrogenase [Cryptosporangium aurantiacum]